MDSNPFDTWAVLRIQAGPTALWIGYEDDKGRRRNPPKDLTGESADWISSASPPLSLSGPFLEWMRPETLAPIDLKDLINDAISSLPAMRYGPHANGPVPMPIFLDLPRGVSVADWKLFLNGLLSIEEDRVEFVRLPRRKWSSRPPFSLPLKVLAVGRDCASVLENMRSASWYKDDEETQIHGLQIQTVEPQHVSNALRAETHDVIVTNDQSVMTVLNGAKQLSKPLTTRPRLIVFLTSNSIDPEIENLSVPSGVSLLCASRSYPEQDGVAEVLEQFLYGIIHDYPLHEALKAAARTSKGYPDHFPLLIADPRSNQDLRMRDALSLIRNEALTLRQTVGRGDLDAFFVRMGEDATGELRSALYSAYELRAPITEAIDLTKSLSADFGRETWGLVPLARASASLERARAARNEVKLALASVSTDSKNIEALEKHQDRRVDATLEEEDDDSFIYRPLEPKSKLRMGARYRLRVHIGRRSDDSLMERELPIPPIDPLLPPPEGKPGHTLDVVVFEKDFVLTSKRVQSLYLPPLQGSEPVYFNLVAPHQETAELRIGIYHQNHLLQSFVLEARIGAQADPSEAEPQVRIRLKFSRTARFGNLNDLAPRMLSIGVNESKTGATHTFMFKRGGKAYSLNLTQQILSENTKSFRKLLLDATFDANGNPRFATYPAPGAAPSPEFEDQIRTFADFGRELYQATFIRGNSALQSEMRAVRSRSDETIQVARLDANFTFPWTVLYDFQLPRKISGGPPAPVCLGRGASNATGDQLVKQCSHGPNDQVYCIYGFWGVRHRVEQHVGEAVSRDAVTKIQPNPQAGICLAVGENDPHTDEMTTDLRASLGAAVAELGANDDLLDVLWLSQSRPALLIALGHLETAEIQGEPVGPRLVLQPKKKWLQAAPITDRQIADGDWDAPRTLVLLMACGSGATDITTLNDLVMALDSVGAAAVVGTECTVFSRLVARFAKEVTADLWSGTLSLGDAIKSFNRRLLGSGNPLPFVFSYVGDADLTIASK